MYKGLRGEMQHENFLMLTSPNLYLLLGTLRINNLRVYFFHFIRLEYIL